MFGTEMHLITFVILVFQTLVLSAQCIIYFSRPKDTSRLRFLLLIITYIIYNLFSGLFPDKKIPIDITLQIILAYASGIIVAVYFIFYIYKEFHIYPFKFFGVQSLLYTLGISFMGLFVFPYLFTGNLKLSRRLFLVVPIIVSVAFFIQVSKALFTIYQEGCNKESRLFKYRVIAGNLGLFTLSLMPVVVAFGDYQSIEQSIVNFGFILMMAIYIYSIIVHAQEEGRLLAQLKSTHNASEIPIKNDILKDILNKLQSFEDNQEYLKKKITIGVLAKEFDTNTRYISYIVNTYKEKTFRRYVNDLRIEYAKQRMQTDTLFRNKFTFKAMANEIGFSSSEALTNTFYTLEQIKLSDYIKQVRDSENHSHDI